MRRNIGLAQIICNVVLVPDIYCAVLPEALARMIHIDDMDTRSRIGGNCAVDVVPAVQRIRRGATIPSTEQALRAPHRSVQNQSQLQRIGLGHRRRKNDHRIVRPAYRYMQNRVYGIQGANARAAASGEREARMDGLGPKPNDARKMVTPSTK